MVLLRRFNCWVFSRFLFPIDLSPDSETFHFRALICREEGYHCCQYALCIAASVYEVNILLPGAYTRDIWIFSLNPKFSFHSSLYSLEVKDLESRKHMAPACLPSSLLGVTISHSITHTLLPSDPSQQTLVCIHFLIFSEQMPTQKKKKSI